MPSKKYSINWEDGQVVSYEVDGVTYKSLDEIPDDEDMQKLLAMENAADDQAFFNEPVGNASKSGLSAEKVILWVFSGVAALMLLIALVSAGSAVWSMMNQRSAPGRVVDMVVKREYVSEQDRIIQEYYYPVVDFVADDGRRRSVQMSVGSNLPGYEKGDEVTVLYDPQHPLDARIKDMGSLVMDWIVPGITGILGIAFLGAALMVRRFFLPQEDPKPAAA